MRFEDIAYRPGRFRRPGCIAVDAKRVRGRVNDFAIARGNAALFRECRCLRGDDINVAVYGTGFRSRHECPVRFVRTIDECLGNKFQIVSFGSKLLETVWLWMVRVVAPAAIAAIMWYSVTE